MTFLFRRPRNVWRTIAVFFFFCQSSRVVSSHYITSRRAANGCLSPRVAAAGQRGVFESGDGRQEEQDGCTVDG